MPPADDLWVITTYFNSARYASRRANYDLFAEGLARQGVSCLTVECAFGDEPFALPASPRLLRRRSPAVLWQKERLLNVALAALPPHVTKVAWLDADVLFQNPSWALDASRMLERHDVVQLFESVVRLPRGRTEDDGTGESWVGFVAQCSLTPGCEQHGWDWHGHTGFAWAARRDYLERCGFFDACLTGSGDHLMAHGFLGDLGSRCVDGMIGVRTPLHRAFVRWAEAARLGPEGLGLVRGTLFHLWHGEMRDRKYWQRSQEFKAFEFDPAVDVKISDGAFVWSGANPRLEDWAARMFVDRREDGDG